MGIGTLLGYLIGNRAAILTLAAHPRAWVVGLVFVLSAGFAREYDGEDLLHEPWHLLLPLAASLGSSFFLYCILYGISTFSRQDGPSFFSAYRSFLNLFWLTAEDDDFVAIGAECASQQRADVSRAAGNDDFHVTLLGHRTVLAFRC